MRNKTIDKMLKNLNEENDNPDYIKEFENLLKHCDGMKKAYEHYMKENLNMARKSTGEKHYEYLAAAEHDKGYMKAMDIVMREIQETLTTLKRAW